VGGLAPSQFHNLPIVMLINRLAWRNKFLMNSALAVKRKKGHEHGNDIHPDLPCFYQSWR
jgi:hypothetical protein